jgi:hypothetical protein
MSKNNQPVSLQYLHLALEAARSLRREAVRRGHPARTRGAALGAAGGAMLGSFGGPLGAAAGGALGGYIGALVGAGQDRPTGGRP